jgi:MYXO-CTERM domain-containing protein
LHANVPMPRPFHLAAVCAALGAFLVAGPSLAGMSGGSGGATGTRKEWPCVGCAVQVPAGYDASKGAKLLVALHGDEGTAVYTFNMWGKYTSKTTDFILFAPQCPLPSCSDGSWWKTGPPSDKWIDDQVEKIEKEYNIDLDNEFLTGWSGGATYLGAAMIPLFSDRYGAANLNAGGVPPSGGSAACPKCKMPLWIREGDADFMKPYCDATNKYYLGCGNKVTYELLPGLDHQHTIDSLDTIPKIPAILDWYRANPNVCPTRRPGIGGTDAGPPPADGAITDSGDPTTDAGGPFDDGGMGADAAAADSDPNAANGGGDSGGCGCRHGRPGRASLHWVVFALALAAVWRRRASTSTTSSRLSVH